MSVIFLPILLDFRLFSLLSLDNCFMPPFLHTELGGFDREKERRNRRGCVRLHAARPQSDCCMELHCIASPDFPTLTISSQLPKKHTTTKNSISCALVERTIISLSEQLEREHTFMLSFNQKN